MVIGGILFSFMIIIGEFHMAIIFLLGLIVAIINFILNGIILEKTIMSRCRIIKIIAPFNYIVRVSIIVGISLPFIYNLKFILAYIIGFTMVFPILIISWTRKKVRCK